MLEPRNLRPAGQQGRHILSQKNIIGYWWRAPPVPSGVEVGGSGPGFEAAVSWFHATLAWMTESVSKIFNFIFRGGEEVSLSPKSWVSDGTTYSSVSWGLQTFTQLWILFFILLFLLSIWLCMLNMSTEFHLVAAGLVEIMLDSNCIFQGLTSFILQFHGTTGYNCSENRITC